MEGAERAAAIRKITELPPEQVLKVLIFRSCTNRLKPF